MAKKADAEIEQIFKKFDSNGDGKISSKELRSLLVALGTETSKDEVSKMMNELDKNGDGFIDLKEFAEFQKSSAGNGDDDSVANGRADAKTKELREAFEMYDKDKNGLISARELQTVLKSIGENVSLKDCTKMIKNVDVDGDGHVNFEEFKKMMA